MDELTTIEPVVRLELSIVGEPKKLGDLRFSARYVATAPTIVFHRNITGEIPDELRLTFTDAHGNVRVIERLVMSLPVATRLRAEDFVTVTPETPLSFEFPVWGLQSLEPGAYTIVAEHVGGIGTYTTEDARTLDAGAYTAPIVSNPVQFHHSP